MTTLAKVRRHRILLLSSLFHFTNDACFAVLSPLLPLIASEFHLSYLQVGFFKTLLTSSSSLLQVPVSLLGERFGELLVLAIGNGWVGLGITGMALAPAYGLVLFSSVLAGIGGNAQHPLAASLVVHSYETRRRPRAIALLNMAGTLGKLFATFSAALLAASFGWRVPLLCVGLLTFPIVWVSWYLRKEKPSSYSEPARKSLNTPDHSTWKATLLISAGCLDEIAQKVAFTFLPFLFVSKGLKIEIIGLLMSLILLGGIMGKFVCSWLSERWGAFALILSTEVLTALAFVAFLAIFSAGNSNLALIPLCFVCGIPLDGTSSLLQSSLSVIIPEARRTRWYGIYCTATLLSSSFALFMYGAFADWTGLTPVFVVSALLTAVIPLLMWPLRQSLKYGLSQ
ncbi:MAG: MFS transporter [Ktedonobacteraceae bacterium]|nr:MFS transporter [Ktedonobacteraceae bacterium]